MIQPSLDSRNLRTGIVLGGLALAFFVGMLVKFLLR